ncbi:hypothetical protein EVAR_100747_1 [Eumeta japonica]|uniref:Uncharacterized protein n=1 Tax=Eumeta variegata TaxID=151549 RepID=A0A4C1Z9U9_EUMVA|nr:hypothetical protein EVAR_100747_1 [Eumeta japonica]
MRPLHYPRFALGYRTIARCAGVKAPVATTFKLERSTGKKNRAERKINTIGRGNGCSRSGPVARRSRRRLLIFSPSEIEECELQCLIEIKYALNNPFEVKDDIVQFDRWPSDTGSYKSKPFCEPTIAL